MILGVCGSPRSQATEYTLNKALEMLDDLGYKTEFWSVRGKSIGFCKHCNYCFEGNGCILNDDIQSLYPLLEEAAAYIFATPVYNGGVSAQIKAVMDRTRAMFVKKIDVFRGKLGAIITVGGDRTGGQELAMQQIMTYYTLNGAVTISGGAFGANLGVSFWSKDTLEGVKADKEGFRILKKVVKRLDEELKRNSSD